MAQRQGSSSRRKLLIGSLALASLTAKPAAALVATPVQSKGPFYPPHPPLDDDNDLLSVKGQSDQAAGKVLHLFGRILDRSGNPLKGSRLEIWQCDSKGYYHHPGDRGGRADPNFQGFGHNLSDEMGHFRFRTLVPVPYPGRTPHIHLQAIVPGKGSLVTQLYIKGHPLNESDFLYRRLGDKDARQSVEMALEDADGIEKDAKSSSIDIVIA